MISKIISYNVTESGAVIIGRQPIPKPRMTQSDKWKKRPAVNRYRAYCNILRLIDNRLSGKISDILDSGRVKIVFHMPIPKSRKKTTKNGDPHQVKPDIDNLVKAVFDAICKNDSHIYKVQAEKRYTVYEPYLTIEKL